MTLVDLITTFFLHGDLQQRVSLILTKPIVISIEHMSKGLLLSDIKVCDMGLPSSTYRELPLFSPYSIKRPPPIFVKLTKKRMFQRFTTGQT